MKPALALLFGVAFISWMLWMDTRWRRLPSSALWMPAIFLAMASSHQTSYWLYQLGLIGAQSSNLEGSPVNVVFNGNLFLLSILILKRRGFGWGEFVWSNKALSAMYAFYLCSMFWSPFPVPTLKRVIQDFGCVLAALVIVTERDPASSMRVVFVRLSYILFPLSVVFIRWFPDIGRFKSGVSGVYLPAGVTVHKNELGQLVVVFCVVLLWDLMQTRNRSGALRVLPGAWVRLVSLAIGIYLLVLSSSATAWVGCLICLPLLFLGNRLAQRKDAKRLFFAGAVTVALLLWIGMSYASSFSEAMERGEGFSGRTEIWEVTLEKFGAKYGISLLGAGYHGFWESPDGEAVWKQIGMNPLDQAHNGYIETYLNGGLVGLFLLGALVTALGWRAADKLIRKDPLGRLAIVFWPFLLFTNFTEAQFFQVGPLWFTTLLVTMNGPTGQRITPAANRRAENTSHGAIRSTRLPVNRHSAALGYERASSHHADCSTRRLGFSSTA